MNKLLCTFVACSILPAATAQERRNLKGKVMAPLSHLGGIYVVNTQTEKNAVTEDSGAFVIAAHPGDTLLFSSTQFRARKMAVVAGDFEKGLLTVHLEPIVHELETVQVINYKNINAEALGIIPKGQKKYTPAERKLKTASDYDAQFGLNTAVTLDPLFNLLSGRTAELRKNVIVEHKETLIAKIENQFDADYFVSKLKIPEAHVRGFLHFIVENPRFVTVLESGNKTMATFLMGELAVQYQDILAKENQK